MPIKDNNRYLFQRNSIKEKTRANDHSKDRRSGKDRRQSFNSQYFLKGGIERRSWKERRYLWYMTLLLGVLRIAS
jgi:hypothetical protein